MVNEHSTEWSDQGDHWVVRTPSNPTFYGGNQLLLPSAPEPSQIERLDALFRAAHPGAKHRSYEWQGGPPEDAKGWEAAGFEVDTCVALSSAKPRLDLPIDPDLRVERVGSDPQWEALLGFWLEINPQYGFAYHCRSAANWRDRPEPGNWWVARAADGKVIGSMGLYFGHGMGRFQNVDTHPRYQRLGVCRTLMSRVLRHAAEHHDYGQIFIEAEAESVPLRIYESFGFERVHIQSDLLKPT